MYDHQWLPCEFCQDRHIPSPCVKKRGPKTEGTPETHAMILPVPDDTRMTPQESLLFHYACSDEYLRTGYFHVSAFVRTFVAGHGGRLITCPLRYSILAVAALNLPSAQFGELRNEYMQKAFEALIEKREDTIDDADILAAYLLWRTTQSKDEGLVHIKGMVAVMNTLQKKLLGSAAFARLRPLFVEYLLPEPQMSLAQMRHYADEYKHGAKLYPIPQWDDRFQLFDDVFHDSRGYEKIPGTHLLIRARAMFRVLRYDYFDTLCGLQLKYEEEQKGIESVPYVSLERFEALGRSEESKLLMDIIDQSLDSPRIDTQWTEAIHLALACLSNIAFHMGLIILKSNTIIEGLKSEEFMLLSKKLLSAIRVSSNLRPLYSRVMRAWVFLASLRLQSLKSIAFDTVS